MGLRTVSTSRWLIMEHVFRRGISVVGQIGVGVSFIDYDTLTSKGTARVHADEAVLKV